MEITQVCLPYKKPDSKNHLVKAKQNKTNDFGTVCIHTRSFSFLRSLVAVTGKLHRILLPMRIRFFNQYMAYWLKGRIRNRNGEAIVFKTSFVSFPCNASQKRSRLLQEVTRSMGNTSQIYYMIEKRSDQSENAVCLLSSSVKYGKNTIKQNVNLKLSILRE